MLLAALGSVRIGKNCDLGLENAALGLRPRAAFSRPRSQFFPIRTSQPANNIYIFFSNISEGAACLLQAVTDFYHKNEAWHKDTVNNITYEETMIDDRLLNVRTQTFFDHESGDIRSEPSGRFLASGSWGEPSSECLTRPWKRSLIFSPQISLLLIISNDGGCDRWNVRSRVPETDRS